LFRFSAKQHEDGITAANYDQPQTKSTISAQSGRSGPWNSPLYQRPERNKESRKNGGFSRRRALFGKGRLIQRYLVSIFGTSRPSFIS
jgi:hypothetical protein